MINDDKEFKIKRLPTVSFSCHQPCGLEWQPHDTKQQSVSIPIQSASSSTSTFGWLPDAIVFASLGITSKLEFVRLALIDLHMFPL